MLQVAVAIVCLSAFHTNAFAASRELENARQRLIEGESLYSQATRIVAATPSTAGAGAGAGLANPNNLGGRFYERERKFQEAMRVNPSKLKNDQAIDIYLAIGVLDTFLFDAVVASISQCNTHDARLDLKVARALLDEGRRLAAGGVRREFTPPEIVENGRSYCR